MREQARRLAVRFGAIYVASYIGLMVAPMIPGVGWLRAEMVLLVAKALFGPGVPDGSAPSGSGDRAVSWAAFVVTLLLAALITSLWSLRPPRRQLEERAHAVVHGLTRLFLFWMMLGYGAAKVLKSQFPAPDAVWLDESLGDMSPMRLLWAFMGHSTAYTVFTGAAELLAGLLLLFRRTRLLGALMVVAIMSNVLMLNLSYDVPVKIGSAHFLIMGLFVAWPDRERLLALLVPADEAPWPAGRARTVLSLLVGALVVAAIAFVGVGAYRNYHTWGDGRPPLPHEGRYVVTRYAVDGVEVPSGGASERWQQVLITRYNVAVRQADDQLRVYLADLHEEVIKAMPRKGDEGDDAELVLSVTRLDDGRLDLVGERGDSELSLTLEPKRSRLLDRGFHWVTELPYNR